MVDLNLEVEMKWHVCCDSLTVQEKILVDNDVIFLSSRTSEAILGDRIDPLLDLLGGRAMPRERGFTGQGG